MEELEMQDNGGREGLRSDAVTQNMPPTDGGRDAWLVLCSCFVLGGLVWGFPYGFGVFQEYYSRQEQFSGDISGIAAVGTTASGIMYLAAPLVYGALQRYPAYSRKLCLVGFVILLTSLVGASFANTVSQLLAIQGILYGIGGSLLYFPMFIYLDEWFSKRRGLAYGVAIAGDGAGGVITPLAMEWILKRWDFRTAMRAWAIVFLLFTSLSLLFLKHRYTDRQSEQNSRGFDMRFLKSPAFWILQAGNAVQALGFYMPLLYMPSFAVASGWPALTGTVAIALCNAAIVFGATFFGWMCDRYHVTTAINACTAGTVLAVFLFWSFSIYQPMLYIFAIAYGFFAGGFGATWAGCSNPVRRSYPVETGMIISLFTAAKGVSSVISGPLSGLLITSDAWKNKVGYAYGSGYGYTIVFSGATAAFASIGWVGKKFGVVQ